MMNIPEMRFKGFNDEWRRNKLKKMVTRIGDGLHGTPEYADNGSMFFINGNNLKNGKIIIFNNTKKVIKQKLNYQLDNNTILMSINGTIGNLAYYNNENVMLGKSICYLINNINYLNTHFLYVLMHTSNVHRQFVLHLTGSTIKNLSLKIIRDLDINYPTLSEQQQIGAFFSKLDALISAQSKKLTLLKQLKHGYLQRMFPQADQTIPRVRFSGFNDKWQSKKLNIMFNFYKGKGLGIQQLNGTKYPAIIYGELYTKYHEIINNVFSQSNSQGFLGYKNDLLFPGSSTVANGTAQANALMVDNVQLGGDIIIARPKQDDIDSSFMSYQINSQKSKLYPIIVGTTITHMYGKDLSKLKFMITGLLEQQKIGSLFAKLDHLIELQNHKLALLQQLKKGYLQKMFC